jgi:hypothetical protein
MMINILLLLGESFRNCYWPNLTQLNLRNCRSLVLDNSWLPIVVQACPNVCTLSLEGCKLSANAIRHLTRLKQLTELDVSMTDLDDNGLRILATISSLRKLSMRPWNSTWFSSDCLKALCHPILPINICYLDVSNIILSDVSVAYLCDLKLTHLNISGCKLRSHALSLLFRKCINLTELRMNNIGT